MIGDALAFLATCLLLLAGTTWIVWHRDIAAWWITHQRAQQSWKQREADKSTCWQLEQLPLSQEADD